MKFTMTEKPVTQAISSQHVLLTTFWLWAETIGPCGKSFVLAWGMDLEQRMPWVSRLLMAWLSIKFIRVLDWRVEPKLEG